MSNTHLFAKASQHTFIYGAVNDQPKALFSRHVRLPVPCVCVCVWFCVCVRACACVCVSDLVREREGEGEGEGEVRESEGARDCL